MFIKSYKISYKSEKWIPDLYNNISSIGILELLILNRESSADIFLVYPSEDKEKDILIEYLNSSIGENKYDVIDSQTYITALKGFFNLVCGKDDKLQEISETLSWIKERFNHAMKHNATGPALGQLYRMGLDLAQEIYNRSEFKSLSTSTAEVILDIAKKISENIDEFQLLLLGSDTAKLLSLSQILKMETNNKVFIIGGNLSDFTTSIEGGFIPVEESQLNMVLKSNTLIINTDMNSKKVWQMIFDPISTNRSSTFIYFQMDTAQVPPMVQKLSNIFFQNLDHINGIIELHQNKRRELLASLESEVDHQIESFYNWLNSNKRFQFSDIVSQDREMQNIFELIRRIAPADISVLINGDTGTGKELIARAIHSNSKRIHKKFVAVNCSAIPETLLEAELFGYEKGAFTGAVTMKKGLVENASGGTLFLDEIGDIPPIIQVKLLRVLQEREIMRLGNADPITVDVRILSATNQDLQQLISQGKFRTDLYYRVNTVQINLPSLADRRDDILLLSRFFVEKMNIQHDKQIHIITDEVKDCLLNYHWPGNIRELENVIEHAIAVSIGNKITITDLPGYLQHRPHSDNNAIVSVTSLKELESVHIRELLAQQGDNYGKVAELLGISRTTLWRKLKEYGISGNES